MDFIKNSLNKHMITFYHEELGVENQGLRQGMQDLITHCMSEVAFCTFTKIITSMLQCRYGDIHFIRIVHCNAPTNSANCLLS